MQRTALGACMLALQLEQPGRHLIQVVHHDVKKCSNHTQVAPQRLQQDSLLAGGASAGDNVQHKRQKLCMHRESILLYHCSCTVKHAPQLDVTMRHG